MNNSICFFCQLSRGHERIEELVEADQSASSWWNLHVKSCDVTWGCPVNLQQGRPHKIGLEMAMQVQLTFRVDKLGLKALDDHRFFSGERPQKAQENTRKQMCATQALAKLTRRSNSWQQRAHILSAQKYGSQEFLIVCTLCSEKSVFDGIFSALVEQGTPGGIQ